MNEPSEQACRDYNERRERLVGYVKQCSYPRLAGTEDITTRAAALYNHSKEDTIDKVDLEVL